MGGCAEWVRQSNLVQQRVVGSSASGGTWLT